ncbi:glycosyltransferase [Mucilaginibacter sp.]|uniref:glycosyltransferase n=1 Tax=Mucilaginibacter sp. TaxID=1882438 RepID=UPI0028437534|nr:glycosyltransferase [Mucilaginibacter sp.]MDR3697529.1 glycosyltransferase [Mucilaginibacter sp.]
MGICLNMIVKNEATNIERLFTSVYPYIDYYVISDTGSTDNTVELIETLGKKFNIEGKVYKHEWIDFAHNRNLALNAAITLGKDGKRHCNWLLIIDADEEFAADDPNWHKSLVNGVSYLFKIKCNGAVFARHGLLWIDGRDWKWQGKVHEQPKDFSNSAKTTKVLNSNNVHIRSHSKVGAYSRRFKTNKDRAKFEINILRDELQDANINKNNLNRYLQLAIAFMANDDYIEAIECVNLIINLKYISYERKYQCLLYMSNCLFQQKEYFTSVASCLLQAIYIYPERQEAYYYLGILYKKTGSAYFAKLMLEKAEQYSFPDRSRWFREDIYLWKNKYELVFVYSQLGMSTYSTQLIKQLLENTDVPEIERGFLQALIKKFENYKLNINCGNLPDKS